MSSSERPPVPVTEGLTWRGLGPTDLDQWYALVERIQDHDRKKERTTRNDLESVLAQSWVDIGADSLAAVDQDGVFRAVGRNAFRPGGTEDLAINLVGGVDPQWRGRGLGRALLSWQRARAEQNVAGLRAGGRGSSELPARIGSYVEEQIESRARLLHAAGFRPSRWFREMQRGLDGLARVPTPAEAAAGLADHLEIVPFTEEVSERVRLAHNEAFLDHWGSNPQTEESWRTGVVEDEAFRPRLSFAVVDESQNDAPVVAYVVNTEYVEDWPAQGHTEGYTEILGVRRQWRGRGLARLLLQLSAGAFADRGHPYATLGVDADNPTGALALYESLGYAGVHLTTYYSVDA